MISTGETTAESIKALREAGGGPQFIIAATHGLFVGDARSKLDQAHVQQVFVTDTVSIQEKDGEKDWPPRVQVSIAPLIASAIRGLMADGSLSGLC
jgi:ribose-phosphate pyrophosphokinase